MKAPVKNFCSYSFTIVIGDNYYDELQLVKNFINAAIYH